MELGVCGNDACEHPCAIIRFGIKDFGIMSKTQGTPLMLRYLRTIILSIIEIVMLEIFALPLMSSTLRDVDAKTNEGKMVKLQ